MALTADRARDYAEGTLFSVPLAASVTVYNGSILVQDVAGGAHTAGYGFAATLAANNRVIGVGTDYVLDATASDGGSTVLARRQCAIWLTNSAVNAVTAAMIGQTCYVEDDEKVRAYVAGGVNVPVGHILDVDATQGVQVFVDGATFVEVAAGNFAIGGNLSVTGTSTLTGACFANGGLDRSAAAALAIGAVNANAVNISQAGVATTIRGTFNVDQAATFDTTVGCTGLLTASAGISVATGQAVAGAGALTMTSVTTLGITSGTTLTLATTGANNLTLDPSNDLVVDLADAAGARSVLVRDSGAATVFSVNSNGDTLAAGTFRVNGVATFDVASVNTLGISIAAGQAVTGLGALTVTSTAAALFLTGGTTLALTTTGANNMTFAPSQDINVDLADAAGAREMRWRDSGAVEVASIDSDGNAAFAGTLDVTGASTFTGVVNANGNIDSPLGALAITAATTINLTPTTALVLTGGTTATLASTGANNITIDPGQNLVIDLPDAIGGNEITIRDSAAATVATIDSDGNALFAGTLTQTGVATFAAAPVCSAGLTIAAGQVLDGAGALDIATAAAGALSIRSGGALYLAAGAASNIVTTFGDNGGATSISFVDTMAVEVANLNSDGNLQLDGTLVVGGLATIAGTLGVTGVLTPIGGISNNAGADLEILCTANQGVDITLGDAVGVELLRIYDSTPALMVSVNSDGLIACTAGVGSGIRTNYAASDAGGANPTIAALNAAFGLPATLGNGFVGVYSNTNAGGGEHIVFVAAGVWWYHAAAVAA